MTELRGTDAVVPNVNVTAMVTRRRHYSNEAGFIEEEEAQEPLPEEIMEKLNDLIGDGEARVTVGTELASSIEFGMKASSFVSVTVACDTDERIIRKTHGILHRMAKKLVIADHAVMSEIRDSMLPKAQQLGDRAPQVVSKKTGRPKKTGVPSGSERSARPTRTPKKKKTRGKFRRGD